MKKLNLLPLLFFAFGLFTFSHAQQTPRVLDVQNMREGENVEYCITHKKHAALLQNPDYVRGLAIADAEYAAVVKKGGSTKGTIYTIPVVFHVLHFNGIENISDAQILNALFILNRDYRKQNSDTATVHQDFQGMPADSEIEFKLATIAPNGQCFNGITRTFSPMSYQGDDGWDQVDAIVSGNNVYNGQWAGNRYLNIFICGDIGGAAGYTYKPSNWGATSMKNGIWILHDYVGAIGTGSVGASRALTHEVGHWLNLDHTWGGNNNPGNASSCGTDDNVQDTPTCIGVSGCLLNANTCDTDNNYWGFNIRDNVENYMDYSYCSKMYTEGQRTRQRNALLVSSTGRANVVSATNLAAVGVSGTPYLCKVDFSADKTTLCAGSEVQFNDQSYNAVASWSWVVTPSTGWAFVGGSSASSENPTIVFSSPGLFDVQLTATDGTNTDSETKTAYIRVLETAATLPYWEGFEDYTTLANLPNWEVYNSPNNNAFILEPNFGHSGTKCARLNNFGQSASSNIDELTSSKIDLSGINPTSGNVTLSFRYAYRKRTTSDYEFLKVFISGNCGENWAQRKTLGGNQLSNQTVSTAWQPSSQSDWVTVHMTNVTSNYFTNTFRMRFKFEGEGGNNFFLDDINLYGGNPSNDLVVGLASPQQFADLNLYPNPTDGDLHLQFTSSSVGAAQLFITDITGKSIANYPLQLQSGSNLVITDTNQLASGSYLLILDLNGVKTTRTFIVE